MLTLSVNLTGPQVGKQVDSTLFVCMYVCERVFLAKISIWVNWEEKDCLQNRWHPTIQCKSEQNKTEAEATALCSMVYGLPGSKGTVCVLSYFVCRS